MASQNSYLGVFVPNDLAAEIRRQARADDRTLSGYIRRLLADAVAQRQRSQQATGTTSTSNGKDRQ